MKRIQTLLFAGCLSFTLGLPAVAQEAAPTPAPRVLMIFREQVKPGKAGAHAKVEAGWPRAFAKANWPVHYLALTSMTGPSEAWFLVGYESLAAWEKDQQSIEGHAELKAEVDRLTEQDGEMLSSVRSVVARYREDLSHRPGVSVPRMRAFAITIVRVRPGHTQDYEDLRKIIKAAHEKAGVMDNHSVFQVVAGMPAGTFLVITPMRSLKEADDAPEVHGRTYQDAIGEAGRTRMRELVAAAVASAETDYFGFSPAMSYPSPAWIAADPEYWTPKPAPEPPTRKTGKGAQKP